MSIPASESPHQRPDRGVTDIEVGGERGREALARLKNAIGRVEASWRPASPDEGFEIVRRRLFQPLSGDNFVARDAVARAFSELYLYIDGKRYWYSTQPTVTRLADDFVKVHACVPSNDIPDEREARLVILGPDFPHSGREAESAARSEAASILESRGSSPRNYKNTLAFLAPDATRLRELEQAVRQYLAWSSIWGDRESLNLDQFQIRQADTKRTAADETVDARIPEAFQWLLVPGQSDPKGAIEWSEFRLQGQESLAARAAKKLKGEERLVVQLGGIRLRHELDRIP